MNKNLRLRFISMAMASIFVVLSGMMLTINLINFHNVRSNADTLLNKLSKYSEEQNLFSALDESPFKARYFSVEIVGEEYLCDVTNIMLSEQEAIAIAKQILPYGSGYGDFDKKYRFLVQNNCTYCIVLDCTQELNNAYHFLKSSIWVSTFGLLLVFVFVLIFSRITLHPVIQSYQKQREFITNAEHELKTPLTVIAISNELNELEHGESENTKAISKQVERLTSMVKNLTALSRMEEGHAKLLMSNINFSQTLNAEIEEIKPVLVSGNRNLNINIDKDAIIYGDEKLIKQMISIVLENASKYSINNIDIDLHSVDKKIIFTIKNDAKGVKDGNLNNCFERFYRSTESRASNIEGSGIGLSVAKEIVTMNKGKISARGEGDHFILTVEFKRINA